MIAPDVSVIVVSFNTRAYLARSLVAIPRAAGSLQVEIIVVDNGSADGTLAMLAAEFPQVRVIQSSENLGFARACNLGAQSARARALLLLNSDCELSPGALAAMLVELEADTTLGGVLCRLLNPDGTLQPSVHRSFPSPWSLVGELFFQSSLRHAIYRHPTLNARLLRRTARAHEKVHNVAWGGGACVLIRRDVFETVGGFDERFFMYCEDIDLCKRIHDAGYQLRYLPGPSAVHHWGKSSEQLPALMLREAYRSRVYYFEKHFPGWVGRLARALSVIELALRQAAFAALALLPSASRAVFRDRASASAACRRVLLGPGHGDTH